MLGIRKIEGDWPVCRVHALLESLGVIDGQLRLDRGTFTFSARTRAQRVVGRGADPVEATNDAIAQIARGAS